MTYALPTLLSLPPPVIFEHNETLHAIPLPPLATFLTSLHRPEHLVRLHDILDRYRTPKSYHRIDVRAVESSELPPPSLSQDDSAMSAGKGEGREVGGDDGRKEGGEEKDSGQPIILPEGVTKEQYLASSSLGDGQAVTTGPSDSTTAEPPLDDSNIPPEAGPSRLPVSPHTRQPASPLHNNIIYDPTAIDPQLLPTRTQTQSQSASLPKPHKPHRIRELRLDLHTLDAAALFALETWRRDVLELPKLEMLHPDSIWYNDPDPTPPPPEPIIPKKRGRPKKSAAVEDVKVVGEDEGVDGGYEALADALGDGLGNEPEKGESVNGVLEASTILRVLEAMEIHSGSGDPVSGDVQDDGIEVVDIRSPSPDVILDDLFDEREENDPDFVPRASPPLESRRASRSRQPLPGSVPSGAKNPRGRPRKSAPTVGFQEHHYEEIVVRGLTSRKNDGEDGVGGALQPMVDGGGAADLESADTLPRRKRKMRILVVELPMRKKHRRKSEAKNVRFSEAVGHAAKLSGMRSSEVADDERRQEAEELLADNKNVKSTDGEADQRTDSDDEEWDFLRAV